LVAGIEPHDEELQRDAVLSIELTDERFSSHVIDIDNIFYNLRHLFPRTIRCAAIGRLSSEVGQPHVPQQADGSLTLASLCVRKPLSGRATTPPATRPVRGRPTW